MSEIPNHIFKQLKLAKSKPLVVETTPIIETHQTTIKIPQKLRAELNLEKGDIVKLTMETPKKVILEIIKM